MLYHSIIILQYSHELFNAVDDFNLPNKKVIRSPASYILPTRYKKQNPSSWSQAKDSIDTWAIECVPYTNEKEESDVNFMLKELAGIIFDSNNVICFIKIFEWWCPKFDNNNGAIVDLFEWKAQGINNYTNYLIIATEVRKWSNII